MYSKFITIIDLLLKTTTLLLIAILLIIDGYLYSSALSFSTIEEDTSWHISALKVSYDNENQIYIAEGEVVISGGTTKLKTDRTTELKADYVEFSNINRDAMALGNVLLISGKDSITCDRLKLNLETETGTIYNGTVFIEENNFYIKGDTIQKDGKATYHADKASITSCDGDNPDWKLSGKEVKVTIDGYGRATNATLWAGKIPALYSPIVVFPAKTSRQTGLLTPRLSYSDRKGFQVEQPLFLATSRGTDATLYSDYMSKRGTKIGFEYRYILNSDRSNGEGLNGQGLNGQSLNGEGFNSENKGTIFYDYLNDEKIDDGSASSEDYSFASTPIRSNPERYWFRMKNSHTFDNKWNTRLDIDYVSDADYLHEFKDGFTGFNTVSKYFSDTFGRSLDEYDDTTRENSVNINRTWASSSLNMSVQWFDNVVARQTDSNDTTLQKLPSIEFNTVRQQLGKTSLYYDLNSEYRYFYRQDNGVVINKIFAPNHSPKTIEALLNGHRTDILPRIYMPLKFGAFYFEPSTGIRQSMWYLNSGDEWSINNVDDILDMDQNLNTDQNLIENFISDLNTTNMQGLSHREMIDFNLELSTKLSRVFNIDSLFVDKIKHEILPKIKYSFIPDINQDELPYFDTLDYIEEKKSLTWTLANRFTSRKHNNLNPSIESTSINNQKEKQESVRSYDPIFIYREFAWMEISQSYLIEPIESDKSFSDISAKIELSPISFFSLNSDLKWSPYNNKFASHDSGITIKDQRGDFFETWYRYGESGSLVSNSGSLVSESESLVSESELSYGSESLLSQLESFSSQLESKSSQLESEAPKSKSSSFKSKALSYESESVLSKSESIFVNLNTRLTDTLNIFFICEHSLTENKNIESHTGFVFNRSCWSMRIAYSDTPEDEAFSFMVNLHGIGEFGHQN